MADRGKVIVINDGTGGIITDPKTNTDYTFTQPYHKQLCLNVGDTVEYELLDLKNGTPVTAYNVQRICQGTVLSYDGKSNGVIEERASKKQINFYQLNATAQRIDVGDDVQYILINTAGGDLAVNLV